MKRTNFDFPEGNAKVEARERQTLLHQFFSLPLTWGDCVSILSHDQDRETRFSRRKLPITIAGVEKDRYGVQRRLGNARMNAGRCFETTFLIISPWAVWYNELGYHEHTISFDLF